MIGGFGVIPFQVPHNETACDGFLINHAEFGNLLFITDAEMCPYDMSKVGINHVLVECNYSIDYLDVTEVNKNHVLYGHMELQTCKRLLKAIYSPNLKTVGLIHLSSVNGNPDRFREEIQNELPTAYVWVAQKGMVITTNKWQGVGRLTKDVEFRQTEGGTSIARFTVACDRRYKKDGDASADFISCVAFGKTAEFINKYFVKGQRIGISGHIQTGNYTNKNGDKVYTTEIVADEVEFVESKGSGGSAQQQTAPPPMAPQAPTMPQQMGAQQPYQAQPTNYAPQYQQPVQTPNTASQAYPQQLQYQQPYQQQGYPQYPQQQMPPQQAPTPDFMNIADGVGDEVPFT